MLMNIFFSPLKLGYVFPWQFQIPWENNLFILPISPKRQLLKTKSSANLKEEERKGKEGKEGKEGKGGKGGKLLLRGRSHNQLVLGKGGVIIPTYSGICSMEPFV